MDDLQRFVHIYFIYFFFFFLSVSMQTCNGDFTGAILKAAEPLCFIQAERFNMSRTVHIQVLSIGNFYNPLPGLIHS